MIKKTAPLLFAMIAFVTMAQGADKGSFAAQLPGFSLKDPAGKTFTDKDFGDGVVVVVTAPILKNQKSQEGWDDDLLKAKPGSSKVKLMFLEDLSASFFKGKALKGMKKDYEPGKEPILLIDKNGKVRKSFKVPSKLTVVLVYDKSGELVYSETGKPSAQDARKIWKQIK
jgi:hypothetical protein